PLAENDEATEANQIIKIIQETRKNHDNRQSIAILVRSRQHLATVIPTLNAAKIPYTAVAIDPLAQLPHIQDLFSLTKSLIHLGDSLHWLSVLRSPYCGLSLNDLYAIVQHHAQNTIWENLQN